jgi:predicted RNase H-like HicB family nuclease
MGRNGFVVRCFAHRRRDGTWYANCIDLCLDSSGASLEEAKEMLHDAIIAYLTTVYNKGWEKELVPRPSSLDMHLCYYWAGFVQTIAELIHWTREFPRQFRVDGVRAVCDHSPANA